MFKNKGEIIILLLLIVSICAISCVNATDESSDTINSGEIDCAVALDESNEENIVTNFDENISTTAEEVGGGDKLSKNQFEDNLFYVPSQFYKIEFETEYQISAYNQGSIKYYREPSTLSPEGYNYRIIVLDKDMNIHYSSNYIKGTNQNKGYATHKIPAKALAPGMYIIAAQNYDDANIMDTAILKVSGNITFTVNDYISNYMSGAAINVRITDAVTGKAINAISIGATFTNGKKTITKYYEPNINGQFSFTPPVGVGTWKVRFFSGFDYISGSIIKSAVIKKSTVKINAKKVVDYKGFKITLKATVKSGGKNVNEGTVTFKINGKTYKAKVKNGVATKKVKLKKIKSYKYSAKYNGNANLKASKKSNAKATLKKRLKVTISFKKPVVYMGQVKKITIKIKDSKGKYVKGGWLYAKHSNGIDKIKIKKGKLKLYLAGYVKDHYKGTNGITTYYKKTVTKKSWLKYVPTSHKYKPVKVKYKSTSKYKCPTCGKTRSHNHYSYGYFVRYTYPIIVR